MGTLLFRRAGDDTIRILTARSKLRLLFRQKETEDAQECSSVYTINFADGMFETLFYVFLSSSNTNFEYRPSKRILTNTFQTYST